MGTITIAGEGNSQSLIASTQRAGGICFTAWFRLLNQGKEADQNEYRVPPCEESHIPLGLYDFHAGFGACHLEVVLTSTVQFSATGKISPSDIDREHVEYVFWRSTRRSMSASYIRRLIKEKFDLEDNDQGDIDRILGAKIRHTMRVLEYEGKVMVISRKRTTLYVKINMVELVNK